VELAAARNAQRDPASRVPAASFLRLSLALEPPGEGENALVVDGRAPVDGTSLLHRLLLAWGAAQPAPTPPEELAERLLEAQLATSASRLHSLDLRSRRLVAASVAQGVRCLSFCSGLLLSSVQRPSRSAPE
jgi:hypothetical protein